MKILALDGALGAFSAAVAFDDVVRASASLPGNVALERGLALASVVLGTGKMLSDFRLLRKIKID